MNNSRYAAHSFSVANLVIGRSKQANSLYLYVYLTSSNVGVSSKNMLLYQSFFVPLLPNFQIMKNLLTLLLCLLWQATNAQVYEKGVSKALAEQRSQAIENVRYDLTFDIPENQKTPVSGTAVISFMLQSKGEVVLDFQGKFSGACIVNG